MTTNTTVRVFLFDQDGYTLIIQSWERPLAEFLGGRVEEEEKVRAAALRELEEEGGGRINFNGKLIELLQIEEGSRKFIGYMMYIRSVAGFKRNNPEGEVEIISLDRLRKNPGILMPKSRRLLEAAFNYMRKQQLSFHASPKEQRLASFFTLPKRGGFCLKSGI